MSRRPSWPSPALLARPPLMDLRELEAESIRAFVQRAANAGYLSGRVLDYGCGKQPYRGIVEAAGGAYMGFDRADLPANVSGEDLGPEWDRVSYAETFNSVDAILCTQVLQYVPAPWYLHVRFHDWLRPGGHLILTYPIAWPIVEDEDLWRFTPNGMTRLLTDSGFEIISNEVRLTRGEFESGGAVIACA